MRADRRNGRIGQPRPTDAPMRGIPQVAIRGGAPDGRVMYALNMRRIIGTVLVPVVAVTTFSVLPRQMALATSPVDMELGTDVSGTAYGATVSEGLMWSDTGTVSTGSSSYATHPEEWDWLCYDQGDEPWAGQLYQTDSIAMTGCGLCSASHCLTMVLGEEIPPDKLAQQMQRYSEEHGGIDYGSNGTVWAGWEEVIQGLYGDRIILGKVPTTADDVKNAVTHGKAVVFNAPGGGSVLNADGVWGITPYGHVLCCYRYADGKFYVKDSSSKQSGHGLGNAIAYSDEDFAMAMDQATGHLGYVYTFEAKNQMD